MGDELHRSFVSGRDASVVDVGIDIIRGFFALMVSAFRRLGWRYSP